MTTLLRPFLLFQLPALLERSIMKPSFVEERCIRIEVDDSSMSRPVLVSTGNGILFRCADHLNITQRQVQAWSRDTEEVIRSLPTVTTRQVRQKMWREARLRWSNDLRAESQSLLSSAIKILQVFEANVMSTPALDPSKRTPSRRTLRNARRLDILRRATVGIDDLYLQAARSQRYARVLLRPSAPKKGLVEVYQGHPQELRRALALRRTRKITPMPLP